ncbi:hypothetical protein [Acaryochloris sp. IP29b_bin.148]|uniref:hypothetical protein n=1 Tax=Acaryochloris sp. IP29b_bin.148 TaxID=2969218 RepID=UPI0026262874|nr:hypothetical protein [Acaryochloris sp. IP29b_bin.148]
MNEDSVIPPSVPRLKALAAAELSVYRWQDQLLPVDTVLVEEDVTVLRQELETAHELLQYQQRLIDSLTEQLVGHETHQAQLEKDLEAAERGSDREAEKLKEFQSICQDLRSQLRRQQARICEYKTVLKNNSNTFQPHAKVASRKLVSFGYASVAVDDPLAASSPVSPWSATDPINFSNAFAICCRQLATLGLDQSSDPQSHPPQSLPITLDQPNIDQPLQDASSPQLELPSFVH